MKNLFSILFLGLVFLLTQCTQEDTPLIQEPDPNVNLNFNCEDNEQLCDLNHRNNTFGFDIFKKLHQQAPTENLFMSPLSIATALSMTANGAVGQTQSDMLNTMEVGDWSLEELNATYLGLLSVLPDLDNSVKLQIANSIWYKLGFPARPEFLQANTTYYQSEVNEVDFTDPAAVDQINGWASDKTEGLINQIIQEIPSNVVMYLINAIYFKGTWRYQFDPELTYEAPFYLEDGSNIDVNMMAHAQTSLRYVETDTYQAVDLPYGDSIFSMSILLPKEGYTVDDLVSELDSDNWSELVDSFQDKEILFSMPKFKMEYEETLNRVLTDLGMGIIFSESADLSGINGSGGLRVSEVKHKAFIEVNEEGTEAAAVTVVVIVETSTGQVPYFKADRPFLFVIHENSANSIQFMGKMMSPE